MLIKIWGRIYYASKKVDEFSWRGENKEMAKINWGAWYYIFGTSGKKKWSKI